MKPQNFCNCDGPWHLRPLGFFANDLKLVNNLIPVFAFTIKDKTRKQNIIRKNRYLSQPLNRLLYNYTTSF